VFEGFVIVRFESVIIRSESFIARVKLVEEYGFVIQAYLVAIRVVIDHLMKQKKNLDPNQCFQIWSNLFCLYFNHYKLLPLSITFLFLMD
jgi:hypothetical protein